MTILAIVTMGNLRLMVALPLRADNFCMYLTRPSSHSHTTRCRPKDDSWATNDERMYNT